MLIKAQDSVLVVIDMQERLVSAMVEPGHTIKNTRLLLQVAEKTMVPALLTEQYPEGLGATISTIRNAAGQSLVLPQGTLLMHAGQRLCHRIHIPKSSAGYSNRHGGPISALCRRPPAWLMQDMKFLWCLTQSHRGPPKIKMLV